ncbi:MAG: hypothetical protein P4L16_04940 [Chlamydiales bacterium]|nr:hypothetical protein [Chlamydiales bacterium]
MTEAISHSLMSLTHLEKALSFDFTENSVITITHEHPDVLKRVSELIKEKIELVLQDQFGLRYLETEKYAIDSIFSQLLVECKTDVSSLKTKAVAKRVLEKINDTIVTAGSMDSSFDLSLDFSSSLNADVSNMIKLLLGAPFSSSALSWELLKAIFFVRNNKMMEGFKEALQSLLSSQYKSLQAGVSRKQEILITMFINNVLALLPFVEPEAGTTIDVPQKIEEKWVLVTYYIEVIELTPSFFGGAIPALGLKPITYASKADPLLIFRGTPQPTANGALFALLSDVIPGDNVGGRIYAYAKQKIQSWINNTSNEFQKRIKVYGQSLGGALALQAVAHQPEKISEVCVFGSPTPLPRTIQIYKNNCNGLEKRPEVRSYWNHGDAVPLAGGRLAPDWKLYRIFVPQKQPGIVAHACLSTAFPKVVVIKADPEVDAQTTIRKIMSRVHHILSAIVIPITFSLIVFAILKGLSVFIYNELLGIFKKYCN